MCALDVMDLIMYNQPLSAYISLSRELFQDAIRGINGLDPNMDLSQNRSMGEATQLLRKFGDRCLVDKDTWKLVSCHRDKFLVWVSSLSFVCL